MILPVTQMRYEEAKASGESRGAWLSQHPIISAFSLATRGRGAYNGENTFLGGNHHERKQKAAQRGFAGCPSDSQISARPENDRITLGQRAADAIARFAGSWAFIFSFTGVLVAWMVINVILAAKAFDPYPFILLNLVLSCVAAIQAPLIMMSQNRQEEKDRHRAENDYKVNLKTEIMIEDLYDKLNAVLAKQTALEKRLNDGDKIGSQS